MWIFITQFFCCFCFIFLFPLIDNSSIILGIIIPPIKCLTSNIDCKPGFIWSLSLVNGDFDELVLLCSIGWVACLERLWVFKVNCIKAQVNMIKLFSLFFWQFCFTITFLLILSQQPKALTDNLAVNLVEKLLSVTLKHFESSLRFLKILDYLVQVFVNFVGLDLFFWLNNILDFNLVGVNYFTVFILFIFLFKMILNIFYLNNLLRFRDFGWRFTAGAHGEKFSFGLLNQSINYNSKHFFPF